MAIRVCLTGATGWAGSALARAVAEADDMEIVGAVGRRHAGQSLGTVLDIAGLDVTVSGDGGGGSGNADGCAGRVYEAGCGEAAYPGGVGGGGTCGGGHFGHDGRRL